LLQRFTTRVLNPTQDASRVRDFRKAAQVAIDGIMEIENYFGQLPEEGKQFLIDNAKSIENELESTISTSYTMEDVKQVTTIPTLLVKGELSPKYFLRIVDILSDNMPNSEQIVIPNVSHDDFKSGTFFTSKVMDFFAQHN
jgi:non-heme chloroperoxidase